MPTTPTMPASIDFDAELASYIATALWSSTDDREHPLDTNYDAADLHPDALASMRSALETFLTTEIRFNVAALDYWASELGAGQIGNDLWLTQNRHGTGFWDRFTDGKGEAYGRQLTELAHIDVGEAELYVGDDRRIHHS